MAYCCPYWNQWKNSLLNSVGERPDTKSGLLSTVGSQCQSKQSKFGFFSAPRVFSKLPAKCWIQTLYRFWGERLVRLCQACGARGFVNLMKCLLALQNVMDFCKPVLLWLQVRATSLSELLGVHVHVHMQAVVKICHLHGDAFLPSHDLDLFSSMPLPCWPFPHCLPHWLFVLCPLASLCAESDGILF